MTPPSVSTPRDSGVTSSSRMLLDTMKSSTAWMFPMPGTSRPDQTLKPSAHGSERAAMPMPLSLSSPDTQSWIGPTRLGYKK